MSINFYNNILDNPTSQKILFYGEVVDNKDVFQAGTIKVRIPELDNNITNDNLAPCYPLLNSYLTYTPQIGERIALILDRVYHGDKYLNQEKRYWLGVIVGLPQNIGGTSSFYYNSSTLESDGFLTPTAPITQIPSANGVYPKTNEIALQGRSNSDIILREGEVILRAGKHETGNYLIFNTKNPAFIQLKHGIKNATAQTIKRTVTKQVELPSDYRIRAIADSLNRITIRVFKLPDMEVVDQFSASYDTKNLLISAANSQIDIFQQKYPTWELDTNIIELGGRPTKFPNSIRLTQETIEEEPTQVYTETAGSVINVVAEKINLIALKQNATYNVTNPDQQITPQEQLRINSEGVPMVYGDKLIELFKLIQQFVASHSHAYAGLEPVKRQDVESQILSFDLNSLLNKHIRMA